MSYDKNPFGQDSEFPNQDKAEIWNMLVLRDIDAFVAADWSMVENDFIEDEFMAIDGNNEHDPDNWKLSFPSLAPYKKLWLEQAEATQLIEFAEDLRAAVHRITNLTNIEINQNRAIARKKFNGKIKKADGSFDILNWQTLYFCKKTTNGWKLTGFAGYLPYNLGKD